MSSQHTIKHTNHLQTESEETSHYSTICCLHWRNAFDDSTQNIHIAYCQQFKRQSGLFKLHQPSHPRQIAQRYQFPAPRNKSGKRQPAKDADHLTFIRVREFISVKVKKTHFRFPYDMSGERTETKSNKTNYRHQQTQTNMPMESFRYCRLQSTDWSALHERNVDELVDETQIRTAKRK